jgi:hypothetical protein
VSQYPLVFGVKLRLTKVNSCGLPLAGAANRVVTDGFVTANFTPQMKDAADVDQNNAQGKICVTERTEPQRKRWSFALELCNVDTAVIALLTSWEQLLDYLDNPNGFQDSMSVESDLGVAVEIWTGGKAEDDCVTPTTDDIFTNPGTGKRYGYTLAFGTEFQLGAVNIGATVSTLTLTGITFAGPNWGRGPYNVAQIDDQGTAGRMLTPMNNDSHLRMFRTPIAPPDNTPSGVPAALAIQSVFTGTNYYFGGPSGAPAIDVAPEQGSSEGHTLNFGAATAGTGTILVDGNPTAAIAYNANAAAVKAAIVAIDDGHTANDVTVTGGPLPAAVTISTTWDADIEPGVATGLTGGAITVNKTS